MKTRWVWLNDKDILRRYALCDMTFSTKYGLSHLWSSFFDSQVIIMFWPLSHTFEQSSRLHMTWGLHWTPSCEKSYSQSIHSVKCWLTHSLFSWLPTPFWIWSWSPLWIPDLPTPSLILCLFRLSISWLMEFCLSSSDSSMEPPIPSSHRH